jgi:Protein of unknown function (DUF2723)
MRVAGSLATFARSAPAIAFVIALAVYARTLLPGIAFGDWGEMQTVPHVLGIAHPTGYPTYILIAAIAELAPIGSVAFRANLLSAVFVAGALATLVAIAIRLKVHPFIAIAATLATGVVGTVWAAATVAEVNPLHLLLAALILHRALVWADDPTPVNLAVGALLIGLSLGNHLLTIFIAPFVVLFVLWAGRRALIARPLMLVPAALAGLLGLAVYAYIPLAAAANPPLPYNHPTTWDGFVFLVTGEQFRGQFDFFSARGPGDFIASLGDLWTLLLARGTAVPVVLGGIGLAILLWRRTAYGLLLVTILGFGLYVWANYLRLEHYLLVPWFILGIGMAVALGGLAEVLAAIIGRVRRDDRGAALAAGATVAAVVLVFAVVLGSTNFASADRSDDHSGDDYVAALFAMLPANAAVLTEWDASSPLWYAQHVEGERPDVLVVDDSNIVYEGWGTRENRIASLICERPVYMVRLDEADVIPTSQLFDVVQVATVRIAGGGPTAAYDRHVYRVQPVDPATCPG